MISTVDSDLFGELHFNNNEHIFNEYPHTGCKTYHCNFVLDHFAKIIILLIRNKETSSIIEHDEYQQIVIAFVFMIQHKNKYSNKWYTHFKQWLVSNFTSNLYKKLNYHLKPKSSTKLRKLLTRAYEQQFIILHKATLLSTMNDKNNSKSKGVKKMKTKQEKQMISVSHDVLTLAGSESQYKSLRKCIPNLPPVETAKAIQHEFCKNQVFEEKGKILSYVTTTATHDSDADKMLLGHNVKINKKSFKTSQTFGIYFRIGTPWKNETMKDILNQIFDFKILSNCTQLIVEFEMSVFNEERELLFTDADPGKFDTEILPQNSRLECRFASSTLQNALYAFEIIKSFSSIKSEYTANVRFYGPQYRVKQMRYSVKDIHTAISCHAKEIAVSAYMNKINKPVMVTSFLRLHFDSIFHKNAITPLDS